MLGLCSCEGFSPAGASRGYSLLVHRLSGTQASGGAARGLSSCSLRAPEHRLNSYGTRASFLCGMWDLSRTGIEPIISCTGRQILHHWATREALNIEYFNSISISEEWICWLNCLNGKRHTFIQNSETLTGYFSCQPTSSSSHLQNIQSL